MYTLAPDEKTSMVLAYTHEVLFRGDVVTKQAIRTSIWLRSSSAPEFIHLLKPQVLFFNHNQVKTLNYSEIYVPTSQLICFHLSPPVSDPLDYDEGEKNRLMQSISILFGTFEIEGKIRISAQTDLATSIETARISWMSVYETTVTNHSLPQLTMQVPMLIVRPNHVDIAL